MAKMFGSVYALFATIPFLAFFVAWALAYFRLRDKKRSTKFAVDVTALFLIGSVYQLCNNTLSSGLLFWLTVLVLLIVAGWVGREQERKRGKINLVLILRIVWRLGFLVFSILYILLAFVGIIQSIYEV